MSQGARRGSKGFLGLKSLKLLTCGVLPMLRRPASAARVVRQISHLANTLSAGQRQPLHVSPRGAGGQGGEATFPLDR